MLLDDDDYVVIDSYKKLKEFIKKYVIQFQTARIVDEYGDEISATEFFDLVESKRSEKNNQTDYVRKEYSLGYGVDDYYLDDEGYSFSKGDFS